MPSSNIDLVIGRKEQRRNLHNEWKVERVVKPNTQYTGKYGEKRLRNNNRNTGFHTWL